MPLRTAFLLALAPALAGAAGETRTLAELELTLELPALEGLSEGVPPAGEDTPAVAWWRGRLGGASFTLQVLRFDRKRSRLYEPGDVAERVAEIERERPGRFAVREQAFPRGAFGYAPFACLLVADRSDAGRTDVSSRCYVLAGLLERDGWALEVALEPPDEAADALVRDFLARGVRAGGPARDPRWSDAEVLERWKASAPEALHEELERALRKKSTAAHVCIRTAHYLILTNSSGGKLFARQMEENYERIADTFPFEEVEGRRLMPVFLFQTRDQYVDFYAKNTGATREAAARSKGYAWKDYYATWYEAPRDPVHIHEQTHQIVANRLRLVGGGSWYQEGLAEYVESPRNDRNVVARLVRDGEATPLRELVGLTSLLHSSGSDVRSGSRSGQHYAQAALLIEFLRESRFGKERFPAFLTTLGRVARGDVEAIDAGFRAVYGVGLEGVEEAWREYCRKR